MKLTARESQAYELGWTDAQAQLPRDLANTLRALAASGRSQQRQTGLLGKLRAAILWELTEVWCSRLEQLAQQLDKQGETMRAQRDAKAAALEPLPWSKWFGRRG